MKKMYELKRIHLFLLTGNSFIHCTTMLHRDYFKLHDSWIDRVPIFIVRVTKLLFVGVIDK